LPRQICADVAAQHAERQARGSGRVSGGHSGMRMLVDRERLRPGIFDRIAQPIQRTDARIAAPRKCQCARAAAADQLVVDQIRRHADQMQSASLLANDLVTGRERNQVRETLERDALAVADELGDDFAEGAENHRSA
jgi:hypothetical protein